MSVSGICTEQNDQKPSQQGFAAAYRNFVEVCYSLEVHEASQKCNCAAKMECDEAPPTQSRSLAYKREPVAPVTIAVRGWCREVFNNLRSNESPQ